MDRGPHEALRTPLEREISSARERATTAYYTSPQLQRIVGTSHLTLHE